jgi:hypothetical protein
MNICKVSSLSLIDLKGTVFSKFLQQALRKNLVYDSKVERKSGNET